MIWQVQAYPQLAFLVLDLHLKARHLLLNLFFFLANCNIISDHLILCIKQIYFCVIKNIFMLKKGADCNFIVCLLFNHIQKNP